MQFVDRKISLNNNNNGERTVVMHDSARCRLCARLLSTLLDKVRFGKGKAKSSPDLNGACT